MPRCFRPLLFRIVIAVCAGGVILIAPQLATAQSTPESLACDRLAGHQHDKTLGNVAPTPFADLKKNLAKASATCEVSAKSGEARQLFQLARVRVGQGRFAQADQLYTQAADAGHLQAMRNLSNNLYNGRNGSALNPEKAIEYYLKLQSVDDSFGYWGLARAAVAGKGMPQNYGYAETQAFHAYRLGETRACYVTALISLNPKKRDVERAREWFENCIAKGHYKADSNGQLGLIALAQYKKERSRLGDEQQLQALERVMRHFETGKARNRAVQDGTVETGFLFFDWMLSQAIGVREGEITTGENRNAAASYKEAVPQIRPMLIEILEQRRKMFPKAYTSTSGAAQVDAFLEVADVYYKARIEKKHADKRAKAEGDMFTDTTKCVKFKDEWQGRYFHRDVRNTCAFGIEVVVFTQIKHKKTKAVFATETRLLKIPAQSIKSTVLHHGKLKTPLRSSGTYSVCRSETGGFNPDTLHRGFDDLRCRAGRNARATNVEKIRARYLAELRKFTG